MTPPNRWVVVFSCVVLLATVSLWAAKSSSKQPIRVLIWSERSEPAAVYPNGINGQFVDFLKGEKDLSVRAANLSDPGQGISEEVLKQTDVLIWFGHKKHKEVTEENVNLVVRAVKESGLGYLPIHSSHYAHPFQKILEEIAAAKGARLEGGPPGKWGKVRDEGKPELIHVLVPKHPIAKGVKDFTIPKTESYQNPFNVPAPDVKVLEGRYEGGQQDGNDGLLWNFGKGKVFYFRPGHESYPIYFQPEVQQVLKNAIRYLASKK